jgi:hypothetical protein
MRRLTLLLALPFLIDALVAWALATDHSVPGRASATVAGPTPPFQIVGREVYGGAPAR